MPVSRTDGIRSEQIQKGAGPKGAHLTYYGGPVISNVKIVTLFWNSKVAYQSQLNSFYSAVTNSAYFDWMSEYDTQSQNIGRGSFVKQVIDPSPPTATTLSDTQIQNEIAKLLDNGTLPANSPDMLYMVHFPPGVTIKQSDGSASCQVFCAYHGTFTHNGADVYYGIIPDQGGACAGGCGSDPSQFNNTTSVASHEMIEAVTDPAVGLATTNGPPLAWYDSTNGEIGDICNGQQGSAAGYTVQLEWSNALNNCVDHGTTSCTPNCTNRTCGSDGCGGSCGTCPNGQSCGGNGQCTTSCTPSCNGKTCGPDGCGGNCGTCANGQTCSSGTCVSSCTPSCNGKQCGPDGCGGSCGTCANGTTCDNTNGTCVGSTSCSHAICSTGTKLTSGCDPCATKICSQDPYCCNTMWDSVCVGEVSSICGESCGGGTTSCAHALCSTGSKLSKSCDTCATAICSQDPYCCNTMWDSICVGEVGSICGETCK